MKENILVEERNRRFSELYSRKTIDEARYGMRCQNLKRHTEKITEFLKGGIRNHPLTLEEELQRLTLHGYAWNITNREIIIAPCFDMPVGNMSRYSRINPNHPLCEALEEVKNICKKLETEKHQKKRNQLFLLLYTSSENIFCHTGGVKNSNTQLDFFLDQEQLLKKCTQSII